MENDMVKNKVREYSLDLFRLTDKALETDAKIRFVRCSGAGLHCRVYIAGPDQELTQDGNAYSLYSSPERWTETQRNYQRCKARLVKLINSNKKL